jgi:hypothetical protein
MMWGRYTEHEARAFALVRSGIVAVDSIAPDGFYGIKHSPKQTLVDWVDGADVLHFHDDSYPGRLEAMTGVRTAGKIIVYHAHIGNIPARYWPCGNKDGKFPWRDDVAHVSITNGYGYMFDEHEKQSQGRCRWGRLPDILDIHHPTYHPSRYKRPSLNAKKLIIGYTYSNCREGGRVNAKRPHGHSRLVSNIPAVDYRTCSGRPFEEAMELKRSVHVVLEEVFTPYLHLSALEGAILGKCVVTNFDKRTMEDVNSALGAPAGEWPFVHATDQTLPRVIAELRDDRNRVREAGERGRAWMLRYYRPEILLEVYAEFYRSIGRGERRRLAPGYVARGSRHSRPATVGTKVVPADNPDITPFARSTRSPDQATGGCV